MVDYTKSTGSSGTMMIRDSGGKVSFWLRAGSSTFNHNLLWGFTVNGVTDNDNRFDFNSGGSWQMVKQWTVTTSQNVVFRIGDSGTGGLGGPTNFTQAINRDTVPDPPSIPRASLITATSVVISFDDPADNGGDAIDLREIVYRKTTDASDDLTHISSWDRNSTFTGLTPGASYYFWARVHNSVGYSNYGPRLTVKMLDEPGRPGIVSFSEITQVSVKAAFVDGPSNGTAIIGRQIGYFSGFTTGVIAPTTILTYNGPTVVTGLLPATSYLFFSRTRNSVGWSDWSPGSSVRTLSGVRVNVGGVWKNAVPYVNVGGVWKIARPWGRQFGYWEETT